MTRNPNRLLGAVIAALAAGALLATAAVAAAPVNSTDPTVAGTAREGSTLTANHGTWTNSPTAYTYQWQRCASDGTACGDIVSATKETYVPVAGDIGRTVRVIVTAANADGKTAAPSAATDVIDSKNGPNNTVRPAISGTPLPGETLTASNGSWSPAATSYTFQWQRCDSDGSACRNIAGATGRTYGVRTADVTHRLRVLVTARNASGRATATSATTGLVSTGGSTTTTTTTVAGNRAPGITFLSLRRVGVRVYARFRVCDDTRGRKTVIERDNKNKALAYQRKFAVTLVASCNTFARNWVPAARFRTPGRYVVTLRAVDQSGRMSRIVSRSLVR